MKRYDLLQTFLKESKQFGAQRQASEANAVEIGLDNLARNAGYEDRIRFSWAMEAKAAKKIMANASIQKEDAEIELVVSPEGKAAITVTKKGKEQKSIPAGIKKTKIYCCSKSIRTTSGNSIRAPGNRWKTLWSGKMPLQSMKLPESWNIP